MLLMEFTILDEDYNLPDKVVRGTASQYWALVIQCRSSDVNLYVWLSLDTEPEISSDDISPVHDFHGNKDGSDRLLRPGVYMVGRRPRSIGFQLRLLIPDERGCDSNGLVHYHEQA